MNFQEQLRVESKEWSRGGYGGIAHTLTLAADRIKLLEQAIDILEVNGDLMDEELYPPDANCSCHISPPCEDCQNWSGQRLAKEGWRDAKARARKITGQA